MHKIIIRVEGFDLQKLLSLCLEEGIPLWNIRILGDLEITMGLEAADWQRFLKVAGNRYRVTIISEKGLKPLLRRILSKKSTLIGVTIFALLLYYQSCFVSEIRIYGYERLTEREIRESLANAGLYEGCSKSVDLDLVEIEMFRHLEDISWVGIEYRGNLAEVRLVEGTESIATPDLDQPCHIVAAKEGYIEKIIAREGKEAVSQGEFVNVGDVLISGILQIEDKTYSSDPENPMNRYVHARGEAFAKTVYRFIYYQEKEKLLKQRTGRSIPGFSLSIGEYAFNSADFLWPYDSAIYEEKIFFNFLRPIPIQLGINRQYEVDLIKRVRDDQAIEEQGKQQARIAIKENLPESVQIINKSLKFSPEENIIRVTIMIEALEDIGKKQGIKEGTDRIGKYTN
ncbi:MAG: sporulation protein YqfD [Eubacteriales bacterium]|nr:sporulation protein YqfD [Eubacteriales bacterium]MDD4583406.1 sporulation protein YqfD [Eubacteriales bacterium]